MSSTSVAIVGAGPYGLSLAAHLSARGVPFRIFGPPMQMWREHMPAGMLMKSDGFACDLYDPERRFTLKRYCAERGIPYEDTGLPVRLETFCDYGVAFQKAMVPSLTEQLVRAISRVDGCFRIEAAGGERVTAAAVVLATGISHCPSLPEELSSLPAELCSHSSAHHDLAKFRGRRVLVIGGGASATDLAALLKAQGTDVSILSRRPIEFHTRTDPATRTLWDRVRQPNFGLGPNFRSAMYTLFPNWFHLLPPELRLRITRRHLPPAAGYFVRHHVEGKVPLHSGYSILEAGRREGRAWLRCRHDSGMESEFVADHIIAATGYRPSIDRLEMLDPAIRATLEREDDSPRLSRHFESNVRGLFFVGLSSANSFGPSMRFARGAEWTASRLSRHLAATVRQPRTQSSVAIATS
jgi:cation diffusion facilitator CzcD-associated flavoprotein CzcO